jgi:hypothetical protein
MKQPPLAWLEAVADLFVSSGDPFGSGAEPGLYFPFLFFTDTASCLPLFITGEPSSLVAALGYLTIGGEGVGAIGLYFAVSVKSRHVLAQFMGRVVCGYLIHVGDVGFCRVN